MSAELGWRRECDDTDKVLKHLGLDPKQCRTDGGWLNVARIKTLLAVAQPPQTELSAEDRAEAFIQAAISNAPDPLRKLGEFLTRVLDEDQWPTAERFLLAIAAQPTRLTDMEIYNEY